MNTPQLEIQLLPGAGARTTMVLMYIDRASKNIGHHNYLLKDEEVPESMNFEHLEKIIASENTNSPTIYGFRLATSIAAEFVVEGKPVTLSSIIKKEVEFSFLGGKMIPRTTLLGYCKGDLATLAEKYPDTSDYIYTYAGILPFHKDIHRIVQRKTMG
jgi:hypothetical protein